MWQRIRGILFDNLALKLASLLLALLLYAHVVTDQEREAVVQIPIAAVGLADTLSSVGELPPRVAVKVRGKWKDLIRLDLTRPFLSIDLAGAGHLPDLDHGGGYLEPRHPARADPPDLGDGGPRSA